MSRMPESPMPAEQLWNRSFILCLCNNLFLFIYYFAMLTVLPIYIMQDLGGTVKEAGLALTLFLVSSIAIRPFSGLIVERLGKKNALRGAGLLFVFRVPVAEMLSTQPEVVRQAAQFLEALRNVDSSLLAQLIHGLKSRQDLAFIVIRIKGPQDHIAELERAGR